MKLIFLVLGILGLIAALVWFAFKRIKKLPDPQGKYRVDDRSVPPADKKTATSDKDSPAKSKQEEAASKGVWGSIVASWQFAKFPIIAFVISWALWFIVLEAAEYQARAFLFSNEHFLFLILLLIGAFIIDAEIRTAKAEKKEQVSYTMGYVFIGLAIIGATLGVIARHEVYEKDIARMKQKDDEKDHPPAPPLTPEQQKEKDAQARIDAAEKKAEDAAAETKRNSEEMKKELAKAIEDLKKGAGKTPTRPVAPEGFSVGVPDKGATTSSSGPQIARTGGLDNTGLELFVPGEEITITPDRFTEVNFKNPAPAIELNGFRYFYQYESTYSPGNPDIWYKFDPESTPKRFPDPAEPLKRFLGNSNQLFLKSADGRTYKWKYTWVLRKVPVKPTALAEKEI
jgi:hypothetical protein